MRPFPGIEPDKEMALKPLEEAAEIYAAWQNCSPNALVGWCSFNGSELAARQELFNEVADCIQACVNLAHALGCEDLTPYMEACYERNLRRGRYEQG